jgi:hypothetical protein
MTTILDRTYITDLTVSSKDGYIHTSAKLHGELVKSTVTMEGGMGWISGPTGGSYEILFDKGECYHRLLRLPSSQDRRERETKGRSQNRQEEDKVKHRYVRSIVAGVVLGYALQAAVALRAGYTLAQAVIPSEAMRVRIAMTVSDPWVIQVARKARTPEEAEKIVMDSIRYNFSADIYGHEAIPTVAETRAVGMRGDCKAQAVALGSVWKAMGVKFTVHHTYNHVWLTADKSLASP